MPIVVDTIKIIVSKTLDGKADYVQIMSTDMTTINIDLIAGKIVVEDTRAALGGEGA